VSLTSNFDFCVQMGIAQVKEIFHLAFKSEDRYPHNAGPLTRNLSGRTVVINVRVLDDESRPADLSFRDEKHILFSFPFDISIEAADSPDPSLSRITLRSQVGIPAKLDTWLEEGEAVLGLNFADVTPADVTIPSIDGLPAINIDNILSAIHHRYDAVAHTYTFTGNTLLLYDGDRDITLTPPNNATPREIQAALEIHSSKEFLKLTLPIHITVPNVPVLGTYTSYGRILFWREVQRTDTTITITMATEPSEVTLKTTVELDTGPDIVRNPVITQMTPLVVNAIAQFGTITEPAFSEAAARQVMQQEIAEYIKKLRFPVYSPKSPDPEEPLSTPVGFLLVAENVLAILLNRRSGAADGADDVAPDHFLGSNQLALAVGRAKVDELIGEAIDSQFPNVRHGGTDTIDTPEGSATLKKLNVEPSDPGTHDQSVGHMWVTGEAEVHIDCWPDPDVSFNGPIFVNATHTVNPDGTCNLKLEASAGEFDVDQSCCDVLIDLLIPIVGIVMLIIIETMIDKVGGRLAGEIAGSQERLIEPIPPVVNGIAEVSACLTAFNITSQGFILPGTINIRRLGRSFEDMAASRDLPRP